MNYYFLLEDERSFIKVLPSWLRYMGFTNERVADIGYVTENCYIMQSGQGVTQLITRVLFQTMDTIIQNAGKIDELIIILDSEQYDVDYRKKEVEEKIEDYVREKKVKLNFTYKIFVCNHCFETWLLGNQSLFPDIEPEVGSDFWHYYRNYNVKDEDPELLLPPKNVDETIAAYHFHYLHEMCRFNKIRYSKKKPDYMAKAEYFEKLVERIETTPHLKSLLEFYQYFSRLCKDEL